MKKLFIPLIFILITITLLKHHKDQIRQNNLKECDQESERVERDHKFRQQQCSLIGNDFDCLVNDIEIYSKDLLKLEKLLENNGCIP